MRKVKFLVIFSIIAMSCFSCAQNTENSQMEIAVVEPTEIDSITFRWHSPGEWNFNSVAVGDSICHLLANPEITTFKVSDGTKTYQLLKKGDVNVDRRSWKFQCLNIDGATHCFYVSSKGFRFRHPKEDAPESEWEFKLYLVE